MSLGFYVNIICDGEGKECLKGEDWPDCDWCHELCVDGSSDPIHHNYQGSDSQCSSRCYKDYDCIPFKHCSLNGKVK